MENSNAVGVEATEDKKRRFRIVLPQPKPARKGEAPPAKYSGIHPTGLRFQDGEAVTEDASLAEAVIERGWKVLDEATGKPAFEKLENPAKK